MVDRSSELEAEMDGINATMRQFVDALGSQEALTDACIEVLGFSDAADWMYDGPISAGEFEWTDIEPGGESMIGPGLAVLSQKAADVPVTDNMMIFLASDGRFRDDEVLDDFEDRLWYRRSTRNVVPFGEPDMGFLRKFVGE